MSIESSTDFRMLSLNTREARLDLNGDETDELATEATRTSALYTFIQKAGVDIVGLSDVSGHVSDTQLASNLNLRTAKYVALDDENINRPEGSGLVFGTNHPAELTELDLDTRKGIKALLELPSGDPLQIGLLYLSDISEAARRTQLKALLSKNGLEKNIPTLFIGDLNSPPHTLEGASFMSKLHHGLFRAAAIGINVLPEQKPESTIGYFQRALREMDKRTVTHELERQGFHSADPTRTPTIRKMGLRACLDHAYANKHLAVRGQTISSGKLSDHDGLLVSGSVL